VVGIEPNHIIVDIGLKNVAFLPLKELFTDSHFNSRILDINFIGEFLILYINETTNHTIISLKQIESYYSWKRLKQLNFQTGIIYAKSNNSLGKGKIFTFEGLKFFALNLHIPKYYRRAKTKTFFIPFKFIEIKDFKHIVHVNSRLAVFNKLVANILVGNNYLGTIITIKQFGIFLNILGVQCLLHISQISRKKIKDLRLLYHQGEQIKVRIFYKDLEQGKVSLTLSEN
ncbi:MAG: S1 RNA-binding domain-containing protein, partial [Sphaerochaetaceae bacterium]|nr:S1 RNA-binding domain-containing protein [Sphaerochaetaceae bacterium]